VFQTYGVEPAKGVWQALTIRRYPSESRRMDLDNEVKSLSRMIVDYHEHTFKDMTPEEREAVTSAANLENLVIVNRHYEKAIQHPIRSALVGNLFRIMLLQLQKQKVEINRVMLTSEEVLEQNDLNFKMMAMAPLLLSVGLGCYWFLFARKKRETTPMHQRFRVCWRETHRIISNAENLSESLEAVHVATAGGPLVGKAGGSLGGVNGWHEFPRGAGSISASLLEHGAHGAVLLLVHEMRLLSAFVGASMDTQRALMEDLDDIENTEATRSQRLRTLNRMYLYYWFLNQQRSES
jgi:nuclear-control-of-ATPase protein 2